MAQKKNQNFIIIKVDKSLISRGLGSIFARNIKLKALIAILSVSLLIVFLVESLMLATILAALQAIIIEISAGVLLYNFRQKTLKGKDLRSTRKRVSRRSRTSSAVAKAQMKDVQTSLASVRRSLNKGLSTQTSKKRRGSSLPVRARTQTGKKTPQNLKGRVKLIIMDFKE